MWMDEEDAHLDEQDSNELIRKFSDMLEHSSSVYFDVDQLEVIIDYYLERAKPKMAMLAVDHGLTIFETNHFLKLRKGQILISLGEYESGHSILKELLGADPKNQEILFGLGMSFAQQHDPQKAIVYYKEAFENAEQDLKVEILVELALQYQLTDKLDFAFQCYKKALKLNENSQLVVRELTTCARRNKLSLEGLELLEYYLDINPYSHFSWFHSGILYSDLGLDDKAIESYDFAIAIKEDYAPAYYKKAETLIKLERYKDALISLKEEQNYREPIALNFCIMADCYENLQDYDKAIEYYNKALELDDCFSEAYVGLGFVKELLFDHKAAIPFYEKAVRLDPQNYNAHIMLASVLSYLQRNEEAKAVVRNLLSIEEGLEEAWIELAEISGREENYKESLRILEEGIETAFSNERLWMKKVVYLHKNGCQKEALELMRELLIEDDNLKISVPQDYPFLVEDSDFLTLLNEF